MVFFERGGAGTVVLVTLFSALVGTGWGATGACTSSAGGAAGSSGFGSPGVDAAAGGAVGERQVSPALSTQPRTPLFVLSTYA